MADMKNRFSNEILKVLFEYDTQGCLKRTESFFVEYKQEFNFAGFANKYIKIFNGLANNKGGYIIFGVNDSTRYLEGMSDKSKCSFEKIDKEQLRKIVRNKIDPVIHFEYKMHYIDDKVFGIFYVEELKNKPAICKCSEEDCFIVGDIFYRYNEEVTKIQYSELQSILDEKRINEQNKWMDLLIKIGKIGASNLFIINLQDGTIFDSNQNLIFIEERILSKLQFIKEGQFDEKEGAPAIKLLGSILINNELAEEENKITALMEKDIIKSFLKFDFSNPKEKLKSIVEMQGIMPIYSLINEIGVDGFVNEFNRLKKEIRKKANYKNIKRNLSEGKSFHVHLQEYKTDSQKRRRTYASFFIKNNKEKLFVFNDIEIKYALDSLLIIDKYEIRKNKKFIFEYLNTIFTHVYESENFSYFKNAILWVDQALFMDEVTKCTDVIEWNEKQI